MSEQVTTKRHVLKRIAAARKRVQAEISNNAARGGYAAGLANEGYAGGYLQALTDVDAALTHGHVSDRRHYWMDSTEQPQEE